jgi:Tfp pilus assembly protein PilN
MRLNINLATQPYEDARRFTTVWTGILGALLLSAIVLSLLVYKRWHDYRQVSHAISIEKSVLQDLDNKQTQGIAILNRPENQDVRKQSDFLNQLILRKEVSWTNIFTNLEKMMPPHLRVLAVQPAIKEGKIIISMTLGGDSRDRVAELVRRMEKSKTFRNAQIVNETYLPETAGQQRQQPDDPMHFAVSAEYLPGAEIIANAAPEISARGGQ